MSAVTRYWHYIAFACWADEMNAKCWCRGRNGTAGRLCRACQRRLLSVDAASIENDLEVAEDVARRSVAW